MKNRIALREYLSLRPADLKREEYRHLLLLLYWPAYLLVFLVIERFAGGDWHVVRCAADDAIPFCEYFVVPYFAWFPFLVWGMAYTLLRDVGVFRRIMRYFILTFTLAVAVYRLYPSMQTLRPAVFPRENVFTDAVRFLYWLDTPTNILPSEHVIGSAAVIFAAWKSESLRRHRLSVLLLGVVICVSTVFLKQHSLLDHLAAFPVCLLGWFVCFRKGN